MTDKPVLSTSDKATVVERYSRRFAEHGATIDSLNVGNVAKYLRQHEIHKELMDPTVTSVTDVGCGIASFYAFLKHVGRQVAYTGIDIVPDFIDANRTTYPDAMFELRDIFTDGLPGVTDHVVMCQVFNNRFRDSDNFIVVKRALALAFESARRSISLDMLSKYVNYEEPHLYYFDPQAVFAYAKTLTPYVTLRHDYAPHHFTIGLYKACDSSCA